MKNLTWLFFLMMIFGALPSFAAKQIQGEVITVEKNGRYVTFMPVSANGLPAKEVQISTESIKNYLGIDSVSDLKAGDHIRVQVQNENTVVWQAETLEVVSLEDKAVMTETVVTHVKPHKTVEVFDETKATDADHPKYDNQTDEETVVVETLHKGKTYVEESTTIVNKS